MKAEEHLDAGEKKYTKEKGRILHWYEIRTLYGDDNVTFPMLEVIIQSLEILKGLFNLRHWIGTLASYLLFLLKLLW